MAPPVSRIFFGRKQTVHFRGTPLPLLRKNAKFSRNCYQHILIFLNQECSYLGWTHEEPSPGAVSKMCWKIIDGKIFQVPHLSSVHNLGGRRGHNLQEISTLRQHYLSTISKVKFLN